MTTLLNGHLAGWLARGPAYGPRGHGSGLAGTFLRAVARAFAWFTVRGLFEAIGLPLVILGVIVIALVWLRNWKRGDLS
jgi:hypothetical protein